MVGLIVNNYLGLVIKNDMTKGTVTDSRVKLPISYKVLPENMYSFFRPLKTIYRGKSRTSYWIDFYDWWLNPSDYWFLFFRSSIDSLFIFFLI